MGDLQALRKEAPVNIVEALQILGDVLGTLPFGCVEQLEDLLKVQAEVGTVLPRVVLKIQRECVARVEDACFVREEAEEQSDKKPLERVPRIARLL